MDGYRKNKDLSVRRQTGATRNTHIFFYICGVTIALAFRMMAQYMIRYIHSHSHFLTHSLPLLSVTHSIIHALFLFSLSLPLSIRPLHIPSIKDTIQYLPLKFLPFTISNHKSLNYTFIFPYTISFSLTIAHSQYDYWAWSPSLSIVITHSDAIHSFSHFDSHSHPSLSLIYFNNTSTLPIFSLIPSLNQTFTHGLSHRYNSVSFSFSQTIIYSFVVYIYSPHPPPSLSLRVRCLGFKSPSDCPLTHLF